MARSGQALDAFSRWVASLQLLGGIRTGRHPDRVDAPPSDPVTVRQADALAAALRQRTGIAPSPRSCWWLTASRERAITGCTRAPGRSRRPGSVASRTPYAGSSSTSSATVPMLALPGKCAVVQPDRLARYRCTEQIAQAEQSAQRNARARRLRQSSLRGPRGHRCPVMRGPLAA
jgi:hypothetical protein